MTAGTDNWPRTLWREWRNNEDEPYSERLFEVVADERLGLAPSAVLVLLGAVYGVFIALLVGLIVLNPGLWGKGKVWAFHTEALLPYLLIGAIAGAAALLLLRLALSRMMTWRTLLAWLAPSFPPGNMAGYAIGSAFFWLLGAMYGGPGGALFIGLVGGIVGGLFGGAFGGLAAGLLATVLMALLAKSAIGVFAGVVAALVGAGVAVFDGSGFPHEYRRWWCWWAGRPHPREIEDALRAAHAGGRAANMWALLLRRLDLQRKEGERIEKLITNLKHEDWAERFVARHTLITLGGEAIEPLRQRSEHWGAWKRDTLQWLLKSIAEDTTRAHNGPTVRLCPRCLVRSHQRSVRVERKDLAYYGCRACGQSRQFLEQYAKVVAVLDTEMPVEQAHGEGILWVSWLRRRVLFDYDWIEIADVRDEEVERFAMTAGNDTDAFRRGRLRDITCYVSPEAGVSENSLRILRSMFGRVIVSADALRHRQAAPRDETVKEGSSR